MRTPSDFSRVIATCLAYPEPPSSELIALVAKILAISEPLSRDEILQLQHEITKTEGAHGSLALVYGGATKIKGYVFEAAKLPEIRGASALLDWVNETGVHQIWRDHLGTVLGDPALAEQCILYASGGSFLTFAPAALGQDLATAVERCYTETTLTANSAAVSANFSLLELRFGRNPLGYWVDQFIADCQVAKHRTALFVYYYPPEGVDPEATDEESLRQRFFNRKSFGELVTVLATMFNRRRDERSSHGEVRYLPSYRLSPWDVKCQSSDVRAAVITTNIGDDTRLLSEASARKLATGRVVKGKPITEKLEKGLKPWVVPEDLQKRSWHDRWNEFLQSNPGKVTSYARRVHELCKDGNPDLIKPADDLYQIAAASHPSRYIGLIYADGNNIGRLMATLDSPAIYQQVSWALSDVAQDAVFQGLAKHLAPVTIFDREEGRNGFKHPFEILAIGGDDLFIVVPGNHALAIALTIAQIFEQQLSERFAKLAQDEPTFAVPKCIAVPQFHRYSGTDETARTLRDDAPSVGLSAGVLIAQENTPFFFMRDLVEELLKKAKGLAKTNAAALNDKQQSKPRFYGGAVDFMVLKSTTMVTDKITAFRQAALNDHSASKRRLTARPYTWAEFAGLLATTRAFKQANFPRSQLYRLRRVLDADQGDGVLTSVMEYLYTRSRQSGRVAKMLIEQFEHAWCFGSQSLQGSFGMPPWSLRTNHGYETIWPDLIELWEFVPTPDASKVAQADQAEAI